MNVSVREKLELLPDSPGVYLMRDCSGEVIYVGKAASIKNRVRSYFRRASTQGAKVRALVKHISSFDYIVTDTEVEALVLECNLIKQYRPKYNVELKDDKSYPYLKVTIQEEYPRLVVTRSLVNDGSRYFGPYTRVGALRETLRLIRSLFPVRACSDTLFRQARPCLNAHIERCLAPCTGTVERGYYRSLVQDVILFLEGKQERLLKNLENEMQRAAEKLDFEKAARYRDQIQALKEVLSRQKVVASDRMDRDIIGLARMEGEACGQVFFVREGKVVGRESFFLRGTEDLSLKEAITAFIKRYYARVDFFPPEILVQEEVEEKELLEDWLSKLRGGRVRIKIPRRGEKKGLVEMVNQNAASILEEHFVSRQQQHARKEGAMHDLKEALELDALPFRIEGYDISNLTGTDIVGSMVVFEGGKPKTDDYRRFKIKSVRGQDDCASLKEVLKRRFKRAGAKERGNVSFSRYPDLIVIDGGKGQLSAAKEVMRELDVNDIPVIALAKREELIFRGSGKPPLLLPRNSHALYLLQSLRDEAHRFAVSYHRNLRGKKQKYSLLDDIPGVGPKRKRELLKSFGSVKNLRRAKVEEISRVKGISESLARVIVEHLRGS